ncbi:hypothetical protein Lalb_Chr18g0044241 [Lupinus albus]|uniref:Uncharacterized protein n=1 Tax=Lupinus albus TaxID=3870 RepID=A0A6A4P4J0_LUPAL|nr:hypothetical protein Lalb_Chr18g0044241 [Lupinus albus]
MVKIMVFKFKGLNQRLRSYLRSSLVFSFSIVSYTCCTLFLNCLPINSNFILLYANNTIVTLPKTQVLRKVIRK